MRPRGMLIWAAERRPFPPKAECPKGKAGAERPK